MSNLFQKLEIQAFRAGIKPRTKESMEWFRKKAAQLGRIPRTKMMADESLKLTTEIKKNPLGHMYMFYYDPKHAAKLPYYDKFPLIIMYGKAEGGFYGLNLHYMPPVLRAKVLDALLGGDPIPEKYIKPMIKHYLLNQVRSRFALVDKPEWEIATFLPTAMWEKQGASKVYSDSRKKMK